MADIWGLNDQVQGNLGAPQPQGNWGVSDSVVAQTAPGAAAPQKSSSDTQWSLLNSPLGGALRGLRDPIDAGAQLLAHGLVSASPAGSSLEGWAKKQLQTVNDVNRGAEQDYSQNWRQGAPPGFDASRIAGNIAAMLPMGYAVPGALAPSLGARMASGAASGGLGGALAPVDPNVGDYWRQKAGQVGAGAAIGGALPAVLGGVARTVQPNVSPDVALLMQHGVRPTPGQIMGGSVGRLEEAMTSLPVIGDFARSGRARAVDEFNRGAINQSLTPIGESLGRATPMGREAISEAADKVGASYTNLVPQLTAKVDPQFAQDVNRLVAGAQYMPADRATQFNKIVQGHLADKISPNGTLTGESFKEAESELGRLASQYRHSPVGDERQLGGAIQQLQTTMRDWLARSNPGRAEELSNANSAYANLLRVMGAAARPGGEPGVFTPAQLQSAVRQLDPSLRKSAFAKGDALMQDYAEAGKRVLGNNLPDSGTPFRSLATILGGAAVGHGFSPEAAAGAAGGGALAYGAYSPLGQAAIAHMLASRPAWAPGVANYLRGAGGPASASAVPIWGSLAP